MDDKIDMSLEAIRQGFAVSTHNQAIAYSGGKDSLVVADLIYRFFPDKKPWIVFGDTGIEFPESLKFALESGKAFAGDRFVRARPDKLEKDGLKYEAQVETLKWLVKAGRVKEVLKDDGKLKSTDALERAATAEMWADFYRRNLVWHKGTTKSYWWCCDQYGYPILGKSFSKLGARRINIDCFLKFSETKSDKPELIDYYELLRNVKVSQMCCKVLKKEPSEREQAAHDVDVIFKGLMAEESHSRMINFSTRGFLFKSSRPHLGDDPFYHCNPISHFTETDVWEYIRRYDIPYSPLYDMTWADKNGNTHCIRRNG
ncbi:MAG: phosphoadenosine phosphosulfate reductase family protein, partial [Kiritimatiellia bacterium]